MWVEIKKDIFEKSDFKSICYILQLLSWFPYGSISRYNLLVDAESIKNTANYEKLITTFNEFKELIDSEFNDFVNNAAHVNFQISTSNKKNESNIFNIEESVRFFNQPFCIILENSKNDAYFVKAIIFHFDTKGRVREHLQNGWLKFENAGGCTNLENFIEGELKAFEDLAAKNAKNTSDYYRAFVILDSDKEFPNQPNKHNLLLETLDSLNIQHHVLQKRMMENYMPDEVLEDVSNQPKISDELKKWLNVYNYLNNEQKDYLKYYDGFNEKVSSLDDLRAEVKSLYIDQSSNFEILKHGFKFKGKEFKNEFPLLFINSPRVNRNSLKNRANSDELENILQKINNML
jgi:hypothetical protein